MQFPMTRGLIRPWMLFALAGLALPLDAWLVVEFIRWEVLPAWPGNGPFEILLWLLLTALILVGPAGFLAQLGDSMRRRELE